MKHYKDSLVVVTGPSDRIVAYTDPQQIGDGKLKAMGLYRLGADWEKLFEGNPPNVKRMTTTTTKNNGLVY
jgi:hypothetical protein